MDRIVFKLYGERNSGTNYVEQLVDLNCDVDVIWGHVPRRYLPRFLAVRLRRIAPKLSYRLGEAALNRYFTSNFDKVLGWKHMCPDAEAIGSDKLGTVRFAMLIKNPYAWFISMHRWPHHMGRDPGAIDEFVDAKYPIMKPREGLDEDSLTPIEIWNKKVRSYLAFKERARFAEIVRYEDFVEDEEHMVAQMADRLEMTRKPEHRSVTQSTKTIQGPKSRSEYLAYYRGRKWLASITPYALARLNEKLDADLMSRFGYEFVGEEMIAAPV